MASNATIISSTIPQFPKEFILDGTNYLESELHMMTKLQYHRLWNIVKGTEPLLRLILFYLQHPLKVPWNSSLMMSLRLHFCFVRC